ncbi:hypothetical protein V1525DRAFT_284471 [Lipomyces kononenkoae]|uniref:Uncharacterized protein n=1 Tax=Lipomyces kononenkoae TaxID=34357 RepID=A0ACC3SU58_LIPKO
MALAIPAFAWLVMVGSDHQQVDMGINVTGPAWSILYCRHCGFNHRNDEWSQPNCSDSPAKSKFTDCKVEENNSRSVPRKPSQYIFTQNANAPCSGTDSRFRV